MTITNTSLGRLGLTAADLSLGLCPQAVAHLERCAKADTMQGPAGRGVGSVHCRRESDVDGAALALASAGALV